MSINDPKFKIGRKTNKQHKQKVKMVFCVTFFYGKYKYFVICAVKSRLFRGDIRRRFQNKLRNAALTKR